MRPFLLLTSVVALLPAPIRADLPRSLDGVPLREELNRAHAERDRIWRESPLWNRSLTSGDGDITQGRFFNALSDTVPLLGQARDWRGVARGVDANGQPVNGRDVRLGVSAKVRLGCQALPNWTLAGFAGGAAPASAVQWGRFQAGSTAPIFAANRALQSYDEAMEFQPSPQSAPRVSWLQARALQNKTAGLDLVAAQGRNQVNNRGGRLWGARGETALHPRDWKLRGEVMNSRLANQANAGRAWNVGADGPVQHRFGEARVAANFNHTNAGFAPFSNPAADALATVNDDRARGEIALTQDAQLQLPLGLASGKFGASAARSTRKSLTETNTQTDELTGTADLRWQLLPRIALTGRHRRGLVDEENFAGKTNSLVNTSDSDAGVEVKLSHSLAVTLGAGQTRVASETDSAGNSISDEDRIALGIRHQTGGGTVQLGVSRRLRDVNTLDNAPFSTAPGDSFADAVNFDAQRRFFGWLNLKGGLAWNGDETFQRGDNGLISPSARAAQNRHAGAEISLPFRSRFDVNFKDWQQPTAQFGTLWNPAGPGQEIGARYLIGAKTGEAGLGLSLEYARREFSGASPNETWRLGVTFR